MKAWWKVVHAKAQQEKKKEDMKEINKYIDIRCEAIQGELKHMLSSLLERSSNRIKLDRVIIESGENLTLVTEEKDVQNEVRAHFMKQFRKRKISIHKTRNRWVEAYRPLEEIDENIYESLNNQVTLQE